MNFSLLARKDPSATNPSRISPISHSASLVTFALLTIGLIGSIATKFTLASLPNMILLVVGVLILDVLSQLVPQTRIIEAVQTVLYGVLYFAITCVCGVLAAYSLQRFAFPLQDHILANADKALGFDWFAYAHWVDRHAFVQDILHSAYNTILLQLLLPVVVFACANRLQDLRIYLLTFAIAFIVTIVISALMPAAGPIAAVDRASFHILRFTGATPIDHLMRLREAGPLVMTDAPGGIATFPSFHTTVAILTPLILRSFPRIFAGLLFLDAAMLGGTLTEGAHYFSDLLAGGCMPFFAYALAKHVIRIEDRSFQRPYNPPIGGPYPSTC
jgi:hypothetical protein